MKSAAAAGGSRVCNYVAQTEKKKSRKSLRMETTSVPWLPFSPYILFLQACSYLHFHIVSPLAFAANDDGRSPQRPAGRTKDEEKCIPLQAGEHWLSLHDWGLHLRPLSQENEALSLSSAGCKVAAERGDVVRRLIDVDDEVSPMLKRRSGSRGATLIPATRHALSVSERNDFVQTFEIYTRSA